MSTVKRLFHPTLDTFVDVNAKDVDEWAGLGWLKTKPSHVHLDGVHAPGEHPGIASVPTDSAAPAAETTPRRGGSPRPGTARPASGGTGSSSSGTASGGTA